jgi:diguanylate cyclase (GGDEF)-like protein
MTLQTLVMSADLAIAISLAAVSITALRSGRRPRHMRSWLLFAVGSLTLVAHSTLDEIGSQADAAAVFELLTLALFATGFVLLYGSERDQLRNIEHRAERDVATGLLNREAFHRAVALELRRPKAAAAAIAVVDLDGFKAVNDSRGHPTGDKVLELVASAIRANLRAHDLAARYGGDEFVVYLDDCGVESALRTMERIRAVVAGITRASGAPVTASVGLAVSREGETFDDLIQNADRALLESKRAGKDQLLVAGVSRPAG